MSSRPGRVVLVAAAAAALVGAVLPTTAGLAVFLGAAAPIAMPLVGAPKQP